MALKKFLVGVADVVAMQGNDIVFSGKTMLDTGIEVTTANTEIAGGQGNSLQAIYYHTGRFNVTITETQWSLPLIALNTGASITNGGDVWSRQTITTSAGLGTLVGVANSDIATINGNTAKYVWTEYNNQFITMELISTGLTFDTLTAGIPDGTTICVEYLEVKNSAKSITIPANIIPERVRLYLTANLAGDTTGSGFIGTATVEVPVLQLSGAQTISMTADGYSNTPLSGMAIAYSDSNSGCTVGSYYAKITENLFSGNWFDSATALAIEGGDFTMDVSTTKQLKVWYVANGRSYEAPVADLTFTCTPTTPAGVGENTGLVTATAVAGTGLILVIITSKPTVEASCTVTVE